MVLAATEFTTLLTTALALVTIVATGLAALLMGTLKTLRETNGDLRDQNGDLKAKTLDLVSQLTKESEEKRVLAELVTGEAHLTRIEGLVEDQSTLLSEHHNDSVSHWDAMTAAFTTLAAEIRRNRGTEI